MQVEAELPKPHDFGYRTFTPSHQSPTAIVVPGRTVWSPRVSVDGASSREFSMLHVSPQIAIPDEEFSFTFVRSSGPGGQNVNKVNSKAVLRWPVRSSPSLPDHVRQRFMTLYGKRVTNDGDLVLTSQRYRDAPKNQGDCLDKLRQMVLAAATVPKRRKATRPSRSSIKRRLEDKTSVSRKKQSRRVSHDD